MSGLELMIELMEHPLSQVMARACGLKHLSQFCIDNLSTWNREMTHLTRISYAVVSDSY